MRPEGGCGGKWGLSQPNVGWMDLNYGAIFDRCSKLFKSMLVGKSDPLDLLTIRCNLDARDFTSRLVRRLLLPIVQDLLLLPMSLRFILSGSFS